MIWKNKGGKIGMLTEIDRLLIATPDSQAAVAGWTRLLGAEVVSRDRLASLAAHRVTLRAGTGDIEILSPDGAGVIAEALARRGKPHLFAAGAASADPGAVAKTAAEQGADCRTADGRVYVTLMIEGAPIRFVISPPSERPPAGRLDFFYEATVLARNQAAAVTQIARCFALEPETFCEITSEKFGYTGVLTLFEAGRLHRFEVITPTDDAKTLGRFYDREGCSFYMAFAESAQMPAIEAAASGAGITLDRPAERDPALTSDQLWLHPPTLGGMMLGVSRPTMAWFWSGRPEHVESIDG
jgi:hypothetical protein